MVEFLELVVSYLLSRWSMSPHLLIQTCVTLAADNLLEKAVN